MKHSISKEDAQFIRQFEACEIPTSEFNHQAHLRLAYVYLVENDTESAVQLMKNALTNFLEHNGIDTAKYHETITKAWILAVKHFMNKTKNSNSAEELISQNPEMLDTKIMMTHYSAEVLFSDTARNEFVQPNLEPIPEYEE